MQKRWILGCFIWTLALSPVWAQDSDGDGLPDAWERDGLTVQGVWLDLPGMGADPLHKDIFVQVDYMGKSGNHTHEPKAEALKLVVACFAAAPVSNLDGRTGIHLHVDAGPDSIMDSNQTWGSLSRSKELTHENFFGSKTSKGDHDFAALDKLKATNLPKERLGVFHYCLFLHQLQDLGGTSGYARGIPSDDFVVSLGGWEAQEGTVREQAGTFIHELGHTLGLKHGGTDNLKFKPNYFSVMNYLFQTRGLRIQGRDGRLDYSRSVPDPLDENDLDEGKGVPGAPSGFGTRYVAYRSGKQLRLPVDVADGAIDFNDDRKIESSISFDLNDNGQLDVLQSFKDWPAVVYAAASVGPRSAQKKVDGEVIPEELDFSVDQLTETDLAVSVNSLGDVSADPGSTALLHFEVSNLGKNADTYSLSVDSEQGWSSTVSPATLTLASGAQQMVEVRVTVPAGAAPGLSDDVELLASSGDLVDSDQESVVVAGQIPGGSGANFEGGATGCFVATAAYGSYLDPHVVSLRHFRDECLNPVAPGLVHFYYRHSPPMARAVAGNALLRRATQALLVPIILAVEQPFLALAGLLLAWWGIRRRRQITPCKTARIRLK